MTSIVSASLPRSAESNLKRSNTLKDRISPTKGFKWLVSSKAQLSASKTGSTLSDETKQKLRDINLGKTHTAETRKLLRQKSILSWAKRTRDTQERSD